jgi:hypothetical protein
MSRDAAMGEAAALARRRSTKLRCYSFYKTRRFSKTHFYSCEKANL